MKNNSFAHWHLHSEKSLLDGYGSAKAYIKKAKELGFNYIACTDHGAIDNLIQWQKECDKQGILTQEEYDALHPVEEPEKEIWLT